MNNLMPTSSFHVAYSFLNGVLASNNIAEKIVIHIL